MRTKLIAGITAAVITVSGLGMGLAHAKDRSEYMEKRLERMTEHLNLTAEQQEQVKAAMAGKGDKMRDQMQSRRDIRQQLMQLDPSAPDYQAKLDSLILKAQEQTKVMMQAKAEQKQKLFEILTPEQEKAFMTMQEERREKMSEHYREGKHERHHSGKDCR